MALKILSILSGIAGALAAFIIVMTLITLQTGGFENGAGMALLAFTLWASISTAIALISGVVAYIIARRQNMALPFMGKIGLWGGGFTALVMLVGMIVS